MHRIRITKLTSSVLSVILIVSNDCGVLKNKSPAPSEKRGRLKYKKMSPTTLNTIGLSLDLIGVVLLFFFGLTKNISKEGDTYIIHDMYPNKKEIKKWKIFNTASIIGFFLVILGFLFQIISNYPKIFSL